jgi:hypothetical protein
MLASGAALTQATFNKVACGGGTCLGTSEADWIGGTDHRWSRQDHRQGR